MSQTEASPIVWALAAGVLLAAVFSLYAHRRLAGVVGFLVLGALLSAYWGIIGAPDVALAEAAIGTGVTSALLIQTVAVLRGPEAPIPFGRIVLGVVGGASLGLVLGVAMVGTAAEGPGPLLTEDVDANLHATGVTHPVTAVLLNFRSFDTLLEIVVLLAAAGIALGMTGKPTGSGPVRRSGILPGFVQLVSPAVLLLGAWLLVAGSSRPGGAFQSGAVLAATLILLHAAGVRRLTATVVLRVLLSAGLAAFVVVAVGGWVTGEPWLWLRGDAAGGITLALETVLSLSIGTTLALLYLSLTTTEEPGS